MHTYMMGSFEFEYEQTIEPEHKMGVYDVM